MATDNRMTDELGEMAQHVKSHILDLDEVKEMWRSGEARMNHQAEEERHYEPIKAEVEPESVERLEDQVKRYIKEHKIA